jgi:hypothetical protein
MQVKTAELVCEMLVRDRFRLSRSVWSSLKHWGSSTRRER